MNNLSTTNNILTVNLDINLFGTHKIAELDGVSEQELIERYGQAIMFDNCETICSWHLETACGEPIEIWVKENDLDTFIVSGRGAHIIEFLDKEFGAERIQTTLRK